MRRTLILLFLFAGAFCAWAKDAADHWLEVRSPNFVVITDSNEKQGIRVASQFERMRAIFHLLMPTAADTPGSPIVVLALKNKQAFQSLEPQVYLAKGQVDLAGYFMRAPDKNYILLRLDAQGAHPFATVYHEYTHFMLRKTSEWIPLWLNEGLAEFYQNTDIQEKEVLLGQPSENDILYLRQNRLLPLATLLKVDQSSPYYHEEQKASIFYSESWALTHMLEVSDAQKGTHRLQDYANHVACKEDSLVAAQEAFGDLNQLQKSVNNYIAQGQFGMFKMNKGVAVDEAAFQLRDLPTPDADAIRADVLVYNRRTQDAQALLDSVLRENPRNALAHESMGFLKFQEGDRDAARKWYGEAAALDSQSYLAHYYYAFTLMGPDGEGQDPAIASSLRTSIKLNPEFAPAYDALARSFMKDPAKMSEAHVLNVSAIMLEPENVNYRLNAAAVLSNGGQFDNAVSVLKAASHVAKTPQEVALVQERIAAIQHYQANVAQSRETLMATNNATTFVTDTRTVTMTGSDGRTLVLRPETPSAAPRYPTEPPTGPHHSASGILRRVTCAYPSILTLSIDQPGNRPAVLLYRNDFTQIEFRATNFEPKGDLNPCTDIEGLQAKVDYAEVSDKSIAGQIVSVELSK